MTLRAIEPRAPEPFPSTWRLLDDVAVMQLPDPQFVVHGLLPAAGVGVLYSPPGLGKTTLIASLAVSIATGHRFLDRPVLDGGRVIYIGAEDPAGFKVRLRAAKAAAGLKADVAIGVYTFPEAIDICDSSQVDRFLDFLAAQPSDGLPLTLVVFDTFAASTPGASENSAEDMTTAMVNAIKVRDRFQTTVMYAHHTNAGGTRERGHSAMRGAADFMLSLTALDDVLFLECSKLRNAAPFERIALRLTEAPDGLPGMVVRHAGEVLLPAGHVTDNERKALDALIGSFSHDGATRKEWSTACVGMAQATLYRVADTLVGKGLVQTVGSRYRATAAGAAR